MREKACQKGLQGIWLRLDSAFNTIVVDKLNNLGLTTTLCSWILDFLTNRPQNVRGIGGSVVGFCGRPRFDSKPMPKPQPLDAVPIPSPEKWEGCVRKGIRRKACAKLLCGPVGPL
ncbi:hypothetical protein QTP70_018619 [Hemibagrus guttatus]|uniref:Uncharacterized protein n=1 Tax=Hemibagrus guttatus TaxID=175788 RepID=A0AAE0QJ48_9TELE|nr:hypothetical protein QTP70_018619 [Hemibagrus guttatus]KAK3550172.1 hypothetical protein QTP86_021203 [Hemibagrus guttatus]